jgi:hypothetical protein
MSSSNSNSKFNTRAARVIAAQLYVAKGLKRNPAKMIKFIRTNRDYFPNISDQMLADMQKEHNLTDEQINQQENVAFADIQAERKFEKELLEKAKKIDKLRKEEKRDHRGKGEATVYKSRAEVEEELKKKQEKQEEEP